MRRLLAGLSSLVLFLLVSFAMPTAEAAQIVRQGGRYGKIICYVDGNEVSRTRYGTMMYYIDGPYIREGGRYGDIVYFKDGSYIRNGGRYGRIAYRVDGQSIRNSRGSIVAYISDD